MATFPITENGISLVSAVKRELGRTKSLYRCEALNPVKEEDFLRTLCQERRRTERSGRPILLTLLSARFGGERGDLVAGVCRAVGTSIRETDTFGWYAAERTLAVLFTEIGSSDENVSLIALKLQKALQESLTESQLDVIDVTFRVFPEEVSSHRGDGEHEPVFYPEFSDRSDLRRAARVLKRAIDVVGSLILLALFSPILAILAVLVKLTSDGPVLFRQSRIGKHGVPFTFLKFRSMYSNNDPTIHREYVTRLIAGKTECSQSGQGPVVYKLMNDPRITPLGRFLRKTSLDELPQLINVFCSDMSLVGPRPPVPYEFESYSVWHRRRVLEVKPGITGLWQVFGRSKTTFDEMVRLDLTYAKAWTIWMDAKILLKTPMAVFRTDGAY